MRALTASQAALYASNDRRSWLRCLASNDNGSTWDNLADLRGLDFFLGAEWEDSVELPMSEAKVTLVRAQDGWSLAPYNEDSTLNASSAFLQEGKTVLRLEVAVTAMGEGYEDATWVNAFEGTVRRIEASGEANLLVTAYDYNMLLADAFIRAERQYGSTGGVPLQTVAQSILNDTLSENGYPVMTLSTPDDPEWDLGPYLQKKAPALEAVRNLALQIGWDVKQRWNSTAGAWRTTLYAPERDATVPVYTVLRRRILSFSTFATTSENIRNVVEVVYSDKADLDAAGNPKRKTYTATDAASVARFRARWMQLAEASTSNINSAAEAERLATAAVSDLAFPTAEVGIELPFHHFFEVGDFIRLEADGVNFTSDLDLAVTGVGHRADGKAFRTTLRLRGKPSGPRSAWLSRDAGAGSFHPIGAVTGPSAPLTGPSAPTSVTATATTGGFEVKYSPPTTGPMAMEYELHLSTSSGFTPSSATFRERSASDRLKATSLTPGTTYYGRVVPRDVKGNVGTASAEFSFTARYVEPRTLQPRVTYAALPLNPDLEAWNDLSTGPDGWAFYGSGVWGVDASRETSITYSGSNAIRIEATTLDTKVGSEFFMVRPGDLLSVSIPFYGDPVNYASGRDAGAYVAFYDAAFSLLNLTTLRTQAAVSAAWTIIGGTATAAFGARYAKVVVGKAAAAPYSLLIDSARVLIIEVPEAALAPTLANSWVDGTTSPGFVSYYRDVGLQRIHLQGQVKNGTVGATIFTLPTGYRPETLRRFVVEAVGGTTGVGTLTIASTGAVTLTSGSNTLVSLDGVSFRAA